MQKYEFKEYADLENVVSMDLVERSIDFIYEYFMRYEVDILYIMKDKKLDAIASPGDVHKFYIGEGEYSFAINKKFSFLNTIDYDKAQEVFRKIPTIHEIPVIRNGKFEGVITNNQRKKEVEWEIIREDLKQCKMSKLHTEWLCNDLLKWKKYFKNVNLFIYYIPSNDKYLKPEALKKLKLRMQSEYDEKDEAGKREGFARLEYDKIHMVHKNGIYKLDDMVTDVCKISGGNRDVPNAKTDAEHKIFIFGPCTMFGAYVDDTSTVEYFLQERINNEGKSYQVCNCSMLGYKCSHHRMFTEGMRKHDIVILALREKDFLHNHVDSRIYENFRSDLSLLYDGVKDAEKMFLASLAHCNDDMNKKIANVFFEDIRASLTDAENTEVRTAMQDYYIGFDIKDYFFDFAKKYRDTHINAQDIVGSIVMNCNPFTLGHRFLIERALENVDYLYIFVVEEDKSFFSFEDRMQMVKDGVRDLERVRVIPSGKYIISKATFAQYFDKENVTEIENMDYDVRIFGEVVADMFGISCRFVGEEPFDKVTKRYNETMKRILPEYDIDFIEIPRAGLDGECISASRVRKYFEQGELEKAYELVPESTKRMLKQISINV